MIKAIRARFKQGHRTMKYPAGDPPPLPAKFRGLPWIDSTRCAEHADGCDACLAVCPTTALRRAPVAPSENIQARVAPAIDLGACLFCGDCAESCPSGAIAFGKDYRLAASKREDLLVLPGSAEYARATAMGRELKRLLGRSLKLREVSAGGCNACEADVNVLGTVGWDLGRFGIQFVASPRHADGLLLTGPVTRNMELALRKTWDAIPGPKVAIAVGSCAISGGPWASSPETLGGFGGTLGISGKEAKAGVSGAMGIPVDLWVPGCPPHPLTILDGLLRLVGRVRG